MDEPGPGEGYDFEKLAREIVAVRLKDGEKVPAAAAEIVRKIIISGVQSTKVRQDPRLTVVASVRGVMSGVLLIEKSLPETAIEILDQIAGISQESGLDPTELMTAAMEGIAAVAIMAPVDTQNAIHERIEHKYMGAGAVFDLLLQKAAPPR